MRAAARAAIREIIREEVRDGIERYLNPAFLQMIRDGSEQMQHIFDAVISCDEKHDELRLRIEILERRAPADRRASTG
jgi:hypothetical protein